MPQKAKFSAFISDGKFELFMEKSLNFIVHFPCEPRKDLYSGPDYNRPRAFMIGCLNNI